MKVSRSLLMVWAGQIVSLFGSGLTGFALGVWLYQRTGSASNFALVALCSVLPQLALSPFAGVLVDRYPRRWMMGLADSGAAICTLVAAALFLGGGIKVWHIYLVTIISAAFGALQAPAYGALIAAVLPKQHFARANGMVQLGQGLAEILAPALAGVLVGMIGVGGVLIIDLATYGVAISTLLFAKGLAAVDLGQAKRPLMDSDSSSSARAFLQDFREGWKVLQSTNNLRSLVYFQVLFSFLWSLFAVLVTPMLLGFTNPDGLGLALTVAGVGMLGGSLVMSLWGGPSRRLTGLLIFELISALAFVLMGLRPSLRVVAPAAFVAHFTLAFVSSLNDSLWQRLTANEVRGRVLSLKQAVMKAATLLAYLVAGVLADRVLQPLLRSESVLSGGGILGWLGGVIGTGPGRGIALLLVVIGVVKAFAVICLAIFLMMREVEGETESPVPLGSI